MLQALQNEILKQEVIDVLRTIYDPEIPVNIYDLGLIYGISTTEQSVVHIRMTLTTPNCPVAESFPGLVEMAIRKIRGVKRAKVELVWDPPWNADEMSEAARLQAGLF